MNTTYSTTTMPCSCGCLEPHVIVHRTTADGVCLALWSDGQVTHRRMGYYLRGLGHPRSKYARGARVKAVRLIADDVSLFDAAELPLVVHTAERTYAHTYSSDTDRRNHVIAIALRKIRALENKNC